MSEILCRWLKDDVKLSKHVDPNNFAGCFSSGYLIGELLNHNGLQDDFELFSQSLTSEAKLSNFTRIQPTMALLEIKFNTNMAQEIIQEKPGVATRLVYQLFIALGKKSKMNLTGVAMETMRPNAAARLGVIESDMYKERLKTLVPRQVDLDFDELVAKYNRKQKEQEEQARIARLKEEESLKKVQQDMRQKDLQRSRQIREQQEDTMAKIKEATVKIPKPPEKKKFGKTKHEVIKDKEVKSLYADISNFEKSLRNTQGMSSPESSDQIRGIDADIELFLNESPKEPRLKDLVKPEANDDYVMNIRNRLNEDVSARKEREKRRRRVLIEQMKAHEAQQAYIQEEILVKRLMRQSQVERRIAVQLMNVRKQKDVIKHNRHEQEIQYTERRMKDFQDALDREAEMCRQAKIEYAEEVQRTQELHDFIAKERATKKYEKHYSFCEEVVLEMVDFSCKIGEYRELTEKLLPPKIVREWKALFLNGKPLYESPPRELSHEESERLSFEESKQVLLDEEDFLEYQNSVGEWKLTFETSEVAKNNDVLGYVLKRLNNILYPPTPPPEEPQFPAFPIKACVIGKCFAGKTSIIREITQNHRIVTLEIESAVHAAIQAFENKETIEVHPPMSGMDNALNGLAITETDVQLEDSLRQMSIDAEKDTPNSLKENKLLTNGTDSPTANPEDAEIRPISANTHATLPPTAVETASSVSMQDADLSKPTIQATLGEKAVDYLKKGKTLPDQLLVDIIVCLIRNIPDGTGWILDGFPMNAQQAKFLEKALTGYSPEPSPPKGKEKRGRKSKLANDPQPMPEAKPIKSGIDVVIVFDLPDDVSLKRAEGRKLNPDTKEKYHEEFNPPPDGFYTGLQNKSKVRSVIDESNDKEQIQIRLISFQDNWSKIEKWFGKFDIMTKLDASVPPEELYKKLQTTLNDTLAKISAAVEEEHQRIEAEAARVCSEAEETKKALESTVQPTPSETSNKEAEKVEGKNAEKERSQSSSKKGGKKGKDSPSPTKKIKESPSKKGKGKETPSPTKGKRSPEKGRKSASPKSTKRSRSRSKEKTSVAAIEVPVIEEPRKPSSPVPGCLEWVYAEKPIDTEFVQVLLGNWDIIEETYISSCKHIFRQIRQENETIYRYFYDTRVNFFEFLKRPDEKQIFVSDWQKNYNKFPEDIRSDEEAKCELHQRVDDLCDRLWDICDNRKEEAERECSTIMNENWLQDHVGILINHFISLIQMEVDRFQSACKMMKDYYISMEGGVGPQKLKLITEGMPEFSRLPLVELPPTQPPVTEDKLLDEEQTPSQTLLQSSQSTKGKSPEPITEEKNIRIPLIPRRPLSTELSPSRSEKRKSAPKKESKTAIDEDTSPVPILDLDEKLLNDTTSAALHVIELQNNADLADEEADSIAKGEKANELVKANSKDKKGKKGEKGAKTPSKASKMNIPDPAFDANAAGENSEEEKENLLLRERMNKEYKRAVYVEGVNLKIRIDEIKEHSSLFVKKLKEKAQKMYTDMDDWLGKRFQEEMLSIDKMCEVIRQAIEDEQQLQDASVLEDKEFFIDDDLHVFKTTTPEPVEPPREEVDGDIFTCLQLATLAKQFKEISPNGLLSIKSFITLILDLQLSPVCLESFPEKWMSLSNNQIELLASLFSIKNAYVNWKSFILSLCTPFPTPSQTDLLEALNQFRLHDVANTGLATLEEYKIISTWMDKYPEDELLDDAFDRNQNLKQVFFDVFCSETSEGYLLDYQDMLLYFTGAKEQFVGLINALSIVIGKPMVSHTICNEGKKIDNTKEMSTELWDIKISMADWLQVFNHGERELGGDHRFNVEILSSHDFSREVFGSIYKELGFTEVNSISLNVLYGHPIMQEVIDSCDKFQLKDVMGIFDATAVDEEIVELV